MCPKAHRRAQGRSAPGESGAAEALDFDTRIFIELAHIDNKRARHRIARALDSLSRRFPSHATEVGPGLFAWNVAGWWILFDRYDSGLFVLRIVDRLV